MILALLFLPISTAFTTTLFVLLGISKSVHQNRCLNANVPSVPVSINNFLSAYVCPSQSITNSCLTVRPLEKVIDTATLSRALFADSNFAVQIFFCLFIGD